MDFCASPAEASKWCDARRARGLTLGMVPTMGALHQGHLELVRRAAAENDACVVSIFVNPLQFNESRDFDAYPRDIDSDLRMLERERCAMTFTGTLEEFFPGAQAVTDIDLLDPGPFAAGLEGEHRPGHFAGVRTIVRRLFEVVRPDRAYFGEKDFQQTLVIGDLAREMGYPRVVVCPTRREPSGLAMSSRNQRLGPAQRELAAAIHAALVAAREAWRRGERRPGMLREAMLQVLARAGMAVEYAAIRDPAHWTADEPGQLHERAQALVAARIGEVRLIDNLALERD